jgi:ribonuclease HI
LNIIKLLAHTSWGANGTSLKQIYKSLILSKLEYGAFLLTDAKQSLLKMTIHNSGLRFSTGAFRSSPIASILTIANTLPLDLKILQNAILQKARRAQNNNTPNSENIIKLNNFEFNCSEILKHEHPIYPPWAMKLHANIDLSQHIKRETMDNRFRNLVHSILEDYQDHTKFYTDGSKTEARVGASVYYNNEIKIIKFPDFCSIYTAEALAISHALEIVKQQKIDHVLILSDTLSALNSILNIKQPNTISRIIQNQISLLNSNNQFATLLWIPSHVGIPGNETADVHAKRAITSSDAISVQTCSLSDIKGVIQSLTLQKWQHRWTSSQTKLNEIKLSINPWPTYLTKRRHKVVINRLRIGHTWLTHHHLMK